MPIDEQSTSSSSTITTNTTAATTTVEPRRKRAKIVSACSECRRKKTKCNGENPCRNCEKSGVACVYPSSSSSNDDKKNAPSKAALEAIEERLKTIEDMLRAIIKAQNIFSAEMDPVVSNFLQRGESHSPPSSSIAYNNQPQPLTPQSTSGQHLKSNSPPPQPSPPLQNRLPSIRTLSSTSYPEPPKLEHRDLPPLDFHKYVYPPPHSHKQQQCKYQENDEKKR